MFRYRYTGTAGTRIPSGYYPVITMTGVEWPPELLQLCSVWERFTSEGHNRFVIGTKVET